MVGAMSCRFFILRRFYSGVPPVGGSGAFALQ